MMKLKDLLWEPRKIGQPPFVGRCLIMRKLALERDCPGQQIFPGEEGAIFRGSLLCWKIFR